MTTSKATDDYVPETGTLADWWHEMEIQISCAGRNSKVSCPLQRLSLVQGLTQVREPRTAVLPYSGCDADGCYPLTQKWVCMHTHTHTHNYFTLEAEIVPWPKVNYVMGHPVWWPSQMLPVVILRF